MQIVIEISKEEYEYLKAHHSHEVFYGDAIAKGTPLPEHHSDLIERDALKRRIASVFPMVYDGVASEIDGADAIISATKEGE